MFNVDLLESDCLLIAKPTGIVDIAMAEEIVEFIEIKEEQLELGFNRFCDLTHLEGIRISTEEVLQLAHRRRWFNPNTIHVKSAFFAINPLAFGIARMYEQLLMSPRIEVRVWGDIQGAADWLGVHLDQLSP